MLDTTIEFAHLVDVLSQHWHQKNLPPALRDQETEIELRKMYKMRLSNLLQAEKDGYPLPAIRIQFGDED